MATWHGVRKVKRLPDVKFNDFNRKVKSNCGNFPDAEFIETYQFMHGEWWYVVNGSWQAESTLEYVN